MNQFRQATAICTFIILIGLGSLIACAITVVHTRKFLATAKTATGRVIRLDPDTDNDKDSNTITYHTVFTFTDDSQHEHTVRTTYAQSPQPYQVGDEIIVLYLPGSPDDARIRSFSSLWLFPVIFGAVGLLFPAIGLSAFASARKTYGPS